MIRHDFNFIWHILRNTSIVMIRNFLIVRSHYSIFNTKLTVFKWIVEKLHNAELLNISILWPPDTHTYVTNRNISRNSISIFQVQVISHSPKVVHIVFINWCTFWVKEKQSRIAKLLVSYVTRYRGVLRTLQAFCTQLFPQIFCIDIW